MFYIFLDKSIIILVKIRSVFCSSLTSICWQHFRNHFKSQQRLLCSPNELLNENDCAIFVIRFTSLLMCSFSPDFMASKWDLKFEAIVWSLICGACHVEWYVFKKSVVEKWKGDQFLFVHSSCHRGFTCLIVSPSKIRQGFFFIKSSRLISFALSQWLVHCRSFDDFRNG